MGGSHSGCESGSSLQVLGVRERDRVTKVKTLPRHTEEYRGIGWCHPGPSSETERGIGVGRRVGRRVRCTVGKSSQK